MSAAPATVAVLGTGTMGAPIARNLLAAGFQVRVWNRSRAKAETLAAAGARVAADPAEAVADAQIVITMLADGRAFEETMFDPGGALAAMPLGAVWIQMGPSGRAGPDASRASPSTGACTSSTLRCQAAKGRPRVGI